MSNKKQTAVEFLSENYIYVTWLTNRDEITSSDANKMRIKYLEQAKEVEKQQIIDAYKAAENKCEIFEYEHRYGREYLTAEPYYNETFK